MNLATNRRFVVSTLSLSVLAAACASARAEFIYARLVPGPGVEANGVSTDVDVSADGRTVVFSSSATNWSSVGSTYNGDRAVAVDLDTGVIEELSVSGAGAFRGEAPVVSFDGRYVAFLTYSSPYGPNWQVLRKDRQTGALTVASATAAGVAVSGGTNDNYPAISADGRYVVFDTSSPDLSAGAGTQIFVKDMQTGAVEMASVRSDGSPAGSDTLAGSAAAVLAGMIDQPAGGGTCTFMTHALSGDARYLVMSCGAAMVPGATTGQIYVRDLQANTTELISRDNAHPSGTSAFAYRPAISSNGRFVTFQLRGYAGLGYANGVDSTDNSGVYLRDRQTGTTQAIPRPSVIPASDYDSCNTSSVSDVGSVMLACYYTPPGGSGRYPQVFLYVPGQGAPELLSANAAGQPGNAQSGYSLAVNASGLSMGWASDASNIDPDDHNGSSDIFVLVDESVVVDAIFADAFEVN
jgi:hypothetical protein